MGLFRGDEMSEKLMLKAKLKAVPVYTLLKDDYSIRYCNLADIEALGELYFHSYEIGEACETKEDAIDDINNSFKGAYGQFWFESSKVIEHNKLLVGAILVVHKNSWDDSITCPYIIELFIKKEFRHLGLARNLIITCCTELRNAKQDEVALTVVASNYYARNLYKSLGFDESTI